MKKEMKSKVLYLAQAGIIAALYAVLTLAIAPLAYGQVQFRISEALTILPVFTSAAIPGLTIGCLIANIVGSPFAVDAIFGTAATLLAAICTYLCRKIMVKGLPVLSSIFPVIFNGLIVSTEICFFTDMDEKVTFAVFIVCAAWVALGEIVCSCLLGLPLYKLLDKTKVFKKFSYKQDNQ